VRHAWIGKHPGKPEHSALAVHDCDLPAREASVDVGVVIRPAGIAHTSSSRTISQPPAAERYSRIRAATQTRWRFPDFVTRSCRNATPGVVPAAAGLPSGQYACQTVGTCMTGGWNAGRVAGFDVTAWRTGMS
jgi:hypothetical protein